MTLRFKLDGVLSANAVKDVTDGSFEGLEIGVGVRAEPLVLDFAPEGLDFVVVALSKRSALKRGRGRGRVATCSSGNCQPQGMVEVRQNPDSLP